MFTTLSTCLGIIFTSILGIYSIKPVFILLPSEAVLCYKFHLAPFNLRLLWTWPVWRMISYFYCIDILLVRKYKRHFVKCEDRHPDSIMFIHVIDNNILNSDAIFLRVYQYESKRWSYCLQRLFCVINFTLLHLTCNWFVPGRFDPW